MARTGATANCNRAGDGFCDTPADYATFAINDIINCVYSGKIKDADCVLLSPDVANVMSFGALNCQNNTISGEQINAMKNNYTNLSQRKYLRDGNKLPNLTELTAPSLLSPLNTTTTFFNDIELDWTDVAGAIGYAVELSTSSQFSPSLSHSIQYFDSPSLLHLLHYLSQLSHFLFHLPHFLYHLSHHLLHYLFTTSLSTSLTTSFTTSFRY